MAIGTSIVFNDVDRVVDFWYFHPKYEGVQFKKWYNDWYFNTSIQPSIGINKKVYQNNHRTLYVGLSNSFSFSLYKIMFGTYKRSVSYRFSRFTFEPFTNELFVSAGLQNKNKNRSYHLDLRTINMKFIDEAIDNSGKTIDFYNPIKVRLRVKYSLNGN